MFFSQLTYLPQLNVNFYSKYWFGSLLQNQKKQNHEYLIQRWNHSAAPLLDGDLEAAQLPKMSVNFVKKKIDL